MSEEVKPILDATRAGMEKAMKHLSQEFSKLRAGKAMPNMLESVSMNYYGSPAPLSQAANISAPDSRTIVIQPWDKSMIPEIEKAILESNLNLNPQNDGEVVRLNIPPLTEERRKTLVKAIKSEGENAKISIRSIRKESNEKIKKLQKDGLAEDLAKDAEGSVQQVTDTYISKVDEQVSAKEAEVMTV